MLDIEDTYLALCFDEACAHIKSETRKHKTPNFDVFNKQNASEKPVQKKFKTMGDFYASLNIVNEQVVKNKL